MSEETASITETARPCGESPEPAGTAGSKAETYGVTCPLCGGSLRVREGEKSFRCSYCGSALYINKPQGVRSYMMPPRITAGKARLAALHYLSVKTEKRVRAGHASIIDMELINVPFWRMHGRMMGWICGDKITHKVIEIPPANPEQPVQKSLREEREPYSKLVFKRVDWSTPASIIRQLGLQGISLKTRFLDWDVFDHELKSKNTFALPMKSARQAREEAFNYLTKLVAPARASVRASRFHLFDSDFSLYYYPVYVLRYRHNGRIYTITIDGSDGRILHGEIPDRRILNLKSMLFVPAAFAFLAGTYLPLVLIAAGIVYILDLFQAQKLLPPHRWIAGRLDRWFGGEW